MRALTLAVVVLCAAAPLPASAQDTAAEAKLDELSATLSDRETQERLADSIAVMSEMLLDLPLAPFARAAAEMAGEDPESVDPDLTLRQVAPEADDLGEDVAAKLPRMMDAMAGAAGGMAAMLPALEEMSRRLDATIAAIERAGQPEG